MVLDTSAIAAILFGEPEEDAFTRAIARDPDRLISSANLLEAAIVAEGRLGHEGGRALDRFGAEISLDILPVDAEQIRIARECYRRFGRRNHPAALNFGDCFAYALSRSSGHPLLFKGDDFAQTDITSVDLTPFRH